MPGGQKESMKSSFGILLVVVIGVVFTTAGAQDKSASGQKPAGGEAVYQANCVLCHGSDGHAQTPLGKQMGAHDLHSAEVQKKTDAALKNIISNGQKSMPPFQSQLSSAEIGQVVAYVRVLGKKK